jgi:hypothetical protein
MGKQRVERDVRLGFVTTLSALGCEAYTFKIDGHTFADFAGANPNAHPRTAIDLGNLQRV